MDSGRKKFDRIASMKNGNPNATMYVGASSGSASKIRKNLNETACLSSDRLSGESASTVPKFKSAMKRGVTSDQTGLKLEFAYNEYLQALMKEAIVEKQIEEHKKVLDGQLEYYGDLLKQKQETLEDIINSTEMLEKQAVIIETMKLLEENMEKLKSANSDYEIDMKKLKSVLMLQCDKVILKNIKSIQNQDYDKLLGVLKKFLSTMEKVVNAGRDFEGIHSFAEEIRRFLQLQETVKEHQEAFTKEENDTITDMIAELSDMFAKKYEINSG